MPAQIGHTYGPYRVVRALGGGGMGTVLLAEDARLGRFVALKTVSAQVGSSAFARKQLLREARAAARLTHPNIAAVHDVLDIEGETVIVFEYVEGETLAARLKRGRLDVAESIRVGAQVADALAAAHAQGVVHRDLKPSNVMLTTDGRVKILDFGIAHITLDNEETSPLLGMTVGAYAGTPAYAAPEQWLGEAVGPHTDVFALGLLLFEMLGGRRPFDTPSRLSLMHQVIEAPRPHVSAFNANVPPSIDALVDSTLAREPAQRPSGAREVAAILRSVERDVRGVPFALRARPWRAQRWALAAGVVLLAIVALLVSSLRPSAPAAEPAAPSVVGVLPFQNATGSPDNDYLAAGVADSLTSSLASLGSSGITVLSRSAVREVTTRESEPSKIARELGATYLVEGSVQLAADRVRLSVNLVRPDRSVAWAESAEGAAARVFELQSRLAAALGRSLSVRVTAEERARLSQQPTNSSEALAAYWRGRNLFERRDIKGNLDAAVAAFDQALRLDPSFALAHAARGEALWSVYLDTRAPSAAQEAYEAGTAAMRLAPQSPEVRYALAITLTGRGQLDAAAEELQHALKLRPNFEDARIQLGRVLARQQKIDEAIAEFRKVTDQRPSYAIPYSAMGLSLLGAGRYREAASAFEHVTALQPDNVIAHQQVGVCYQALGDTERALESYNKALAIRPYAPAYSNIGAIHHQRGEYAKAVEAYSQAIALRPNARETYRNLGDAYAKMGQSVEARNAYDKAIELTRNDLEINPRDGRVQAALALYLQKAGRSAEALGPLEQSLRLAPDDFDVLRRVAAVHALAGRREAALDALGRAIQNGFRRASAREEDELQSLRDLPRFKSLTNETP